MRIAVAALVSTIFVLSGCASGDAAPARASHAGTSHAGTNLAPPPGAAFQILPLGTAGGLTEGNLSSYLVSATGTDAYVACDAGTVLDGIVRSGAARDLSEAGRFLDDRVRGFLISHPHFDHVAGLLLSSTDMAAGKTIYGLDFTLDVLIEHAFNWKLWANFTNEGVEPRLGKLRVARLSPGTPAQIEGTTLTVEALPLSHGKGYSSTVFLIHAPRDDAFVAYFGDTGPDAVEKKPSLLDVWRRLGPLAARGALRGILIEVSFPDPRPEDKLFGHLTPSWLTREIRAFADQANATKGGWTGMRVAITHMKPTFAPGTRAEDRIREQLEGDAMLRELKVTLVFPRQGEPFHL